MSSYETHSSRGKIVTFQYLCAALLLSSGCATASAPSAAMSSPLDGRGLSLLFLNGYNTYFAPVRSGEVVIDHPAHELFRPNGTYSRRTGRFGRDGWYAIEGDQLCVTGDGIPKQCRKVVPKGGEIYLLIDVSNNSQALMKLWQVK